MSAAVRVLCYRLGVAEPEIVQLPQDDFKPWQKLVGGYIEPIAMRGGRGLFVLCNEDARALGLDENRVVAVFRGPIRGTFLVARSQVDNFVDLSDDDVKLARKLVEGEE